MKKLLMLVILGVAVSVEGAATGHKISEFPNRAAPSSNMLFVLEDPTGNTNYNHAYGQLTNTMAQIATNAFASVGGGTGSVTSVALTVPAELSVSGSPITTAGTLAVTKATQSANTVWAGPTSGGAAAPTFRALVAADVPAASVYETNVVTIDGTAGLSRWASRRVMTSQYGPAGIYDWGWTHAVAGTQVNNVATATSHPYYTISTSGSINSLADIYENSSALSISSGKNGYWDWRMGLTNASNVRVYCGLSGVTETFLSNIQDPTSKHLAIFRYSTNSANWFFITGDGGATLTLTDTGVAATTNDVRLTVKINAGTNCLGYINGVLVATHTTHLPNAALTPFILCNNVEAAAKGFRFYNFYGEQEW